MSYKEKYEQALERAKKLYEQGTITESLGYVFSELTESEDEKIRKWLIDWARAVNWSEQFTITKEQVIAWLEKQGDNKPTYKVEPKFKVGDWIVQENIGIYKVIEVCESWYEVVDNKDEHYSISFDKEYMCRLWTINDAKDGDVLVDKDNNIGFYSGEKDDLDWHSCIYLGCDNRLRGFSIGGGYHKNKNTKPATKEQRDMLFQAMKEAGYEWDADKKELKKIESKKLDADKVIAWLVANICDFEYHVELFKKDFGL